MIKFTSLNRTFNAEVNKLSPVVNARRSTKPAMVAGIVCNETVCIKRTGMTNKSMPSMRWMKLDKIIDKGMIERGNLRLME
jgi:hypothetical protein